MAYLLPAGSGISAFSKIMDYLSNPKSRFSGVTKIMIKDPKGVILFNGDEKCKKIANLISQSDELSTKALRGIFIQENKENKKLLGMVPYIVISQKANEESTLAEHCVNIEPVKIRSTREEALKVHRLYADKNTVIPVIGNKGEIKGFIDAAKEFKDELPVNTAEKKEKTGADFWHFVNVIFRLSISFLISKYVALVGLFYNLIGIVVKIGVVSIIAVKKEKYLFGNDVDFYKKQIILHLAYSVADLVIYKNYMLFSIVFYPVPKFYKWTCDVSNRLKMNFLKYAYTESNTKFLLPEAKA